MSIFSKTTRSQFNALLDDMRKSYPNAHIMLYNAWGWDYDEPANYIHEVIAARGDPNMSSAIFPWLFEQWHGCEYDHSGMAHVLADHLGPILGWTPVAADVMNGYGIDGNVANGSFEEVAPSGGYGWRYYTDAGVSRIHDPGAYDGEYYLRLSNGAASHQPNPATEGETFTVTVRMRGASNVDQVDMTVDFRDQNIWTDPLQSSTKTLTLTTSWQEYQMTATAPTGTANLVFHTRLTFKAAAGSTVDIDDVLMSMDVEECVDLDGDDYGKPGSASCAGGSATDCDDSNSNINPGISENCTNGIDDDCNGLTDDGDSACQLCMPAGQSCMSGSDCCSGSCTKGKPSNRVCL